MNIPDVCHSLGTITADLAALDSQGQLLGIEPVADILKRAEDVKITCSARESSGAQYTLGLLLPQVVNSAVGTVEATIETFEDSGVQRIGKQ